jgi:hypothetical protein
MKLNLSYPTVSAKQKAALDKARAILEQEKIDKDKRKAGKAKKSKAS